MHRAGKSSLWHLRRDLWPDSDQRRIRSAIKMEVLARHEARQGAAEESTGRAEFPGVAESLGGNCLDLTRPRFLIRNIFARHRSLDHLVLTIGVETFGQKIVDRHVVGRDFERKALDRRGQAGARARGYGHMR